MARKLKPAPDPAEIDAIFVEWLGSIATLRQARADLVTAVSTMPWWAQPGPDRLLSDGTGEGRWTWAPAIWDLALPEGSVRRNIRPTAYVLRDWYGKPFFGSDAHREKALSQALERLAARKGAQEIEIKKAGVNKLLRARDRAQSRFYNLRSSINWKGPSPARRAMYVLEDIAFKSVGHVPIKAQAAATGCSEFYDWIEILRDLTSVLPPKMAEVTARVVKTGAGPFRRVPIYLGPDELDPVHGFGLWRAADVSTSSTMPKAA